MTSLSQDQRNLIKEFDWTRPRHSGNIEWAAPVLGVSVEALRQALFRARRAGVEISFTTSKEKTK